MRLTSFKIALIFGLIAPVLFSQSCVAGDEPSVLVTTTKAHMGSLPHLVSAYGTVQADPSARNTVTAPNASTVVQIQVRIGDVVQKDAPLVLLAPNPQSRADYAKARSALQAATAQLQHTRELLSQYLAIKQQLADAQKAQTDARAALAALEQQGAGGPKELTAPFRATVTRIDANTGMLVTEGTPLLELAPPNSLVLRVGVVPSDASAIKAGDKASIRALGSDLRLNARVLLRGSVVDPKDGLVPVEIALPPNSLLPGETARATIQTISVQGFVVPHVAILINDSGQTYVVQVVRGAAKLVPVRVLDSDGTNNVIAGKLDPAASIVLLGARQLNDGMKVRTSNATGRTH